MCSVAVASPSLTVTVMIVFDVIGPVWSLVWVMVPLHALHRPLPSSSHRRARLMNVGRSVGGARVAEYRPHRFEQLEWLLSATATARLRSCYSHGRGADDRKCASGGDVQSPDSPVATQPYGQGCRP